MCFKPLSSYTAEPAISAEDNQRNLEELKREWSKRRENRNATHINMILDHTRDHLAKLLKEDETGRIAPVLAVYPCFEEGRFVSTCITTTVLQPFVRDNQVSRYQKDKPCLLYTSDAADE